MNELTQDCHKYGHPEFSLRCDDEAICRTRLRWLLDWLAKEVARGKRFLPEQTIQVGWSVLKVKEREDGTLALFEPDFKSMPANFVDTVSKTLLHLLLQKSVNESLGFENEIALSTMQHSVIVCTDFGTSQGVVLSRVTPKGADSGWFCGCDNTAHDHQSADNLRRITLYEAAVALDERIIPYLALPEGILVAIAGSEVSFFLNDQRLSVKPNACLSRKFPA